MTESLEAWIKNNRLNVQEVTPDIYRIDELGDFLLLKEKDGVILDAEMNFLLSQEELETIEAVEEIKNILFLFGGYYYYTDFDREQFFKDSLLKAKLQDFKYLGKAVQDLTSKFAHLGVHGEYELLNGSGLPEDWAKKAKFYGHWALGICEKSTLAGTLAHQVACDKAKIKPILGTTVDVHYGKTSDDSHILHEVTLFAMSKEGWRNLLRINRAVNIDNEGFVTNEQLLQCGEGISLVLGKDSIVNQEPDRAKVVRHVRSYKDAFHSVYYQLDSVDHFDERKYLEYANGIKRYLDTLMDLLPPILIGDSYYLDPEYCVSRMYLNEIKKVRGALSHDQHYKNLDEHLEGFSRIYEFQDSFLEVFTKAIVGANRLAKESDFQIGIGQHKLPAFEYEGNNEDLFFELLEKGFRQKITPFKSKSPHKRYVERLQEEAAVIVEAGFVDYFLILWDIVKWTKEQGYLVGNARGSVAGCLIAYLLDITTVDPIQYDLLFERFLNKTRVSGERAKSADALPDVDIDFGGLSRDIVKRYVEQKYGKEYVVSVGAFTRLKSKGVIKGFGRADGLPFSSVNFVTKRIQHRLSYEWGDFFEDALKNGILKSFIKQHPDMVNHMKPVLNQAQTPSVHASAIVIVPKKDREGNPMTVFDWMPVRKIWDAGAKDYVLISEWEGKYIERAGFLKEDILGLAQMDKFRFIMDLVEKTRKKKIVLEEIPTDDPKVYKIFQGGFNEDVFQFGTIGLQRYSRQVRPDSIEDLIAMNALYRPGPMRSNAHVAYADIKHGRKDPEFDYGLQEVTSSTQGLYIYQEQIMRAVHVLGGLTLSEADEVRTVMKKFDKKKMKTFRDKFIAGAKKNGCAEREANLIWDKLERFSGYGFNRSHAAAYSIMAYWCQWLKCHFEEEFYTAALNFSRGENDTTNILDEIDSRETGLRIYLPDINTAQSQFVCDVKEKSIYWSLLKIKGIGGAIVRAILQERKEGQFESLEEFLIRMKGTGVGRGATETLILAGAFDNVYQLERPSERRALLQNLFEITKEPKLWVPYQDRYWLKDHNWILEQKRLTGYGIIDFKSILKDRGYKEEAKLYLTNREFGRAKDWTVACIAGRLMYINPRDTKKGKAGQLTIESNNKIVTVMVWSDVWQQAEENLVKIHKTKSPLISVTGKVKYDDWHQKKVLFSDSEITDFQDLNEHHRESVS